MHRASYPNQKFHPHSDDAIRGHERDGLHHTVTMHGETDKGYRAESSEGNKRSPRDNKISGMPPHTMYRYGISEDSKGVGAMRADENSGGQKPTRGGMPKHGTVREKGTK